jgi:hypothetical protein
LLKQPPRHHCAADTGIPREPTIEEHLFLSFVLPAIGAGTDAI